LAVVQKMQTEIVEVRERANDQIAALQEQIQLERETNKYFFELATATGDELVAAVLRALKEVGFTKVIDVDQQLEKEQKSRPKSEDIQIHDSSPILIVEVKGIVGTPSDEDALAVEKYLVH
jgi:hypothetical protein